VARTYRMRNAVRHLCLNAISFYQRYVSPYKGFQCAYAFHTGCASCSKLGFRAIRRYGVRVGLRLIFGRFGRCRDVHRRHLGERVVAGRTLPAGALMSMGPMRRQRGVCDVLACVPCDAGCAAAPFDAACHGATVLDAPTCCAAVPCPTPCDFAPCDCWPWEQRRTKERTRS